MECINDKPSYSDVWCNLKSALVLLENAKYTLGQAIGMPDAEPDAPVWDDFFKTPNALEALEVFALMFDACKAMKAAVEKLHAIVNMRETLP